MLLISISHVFIGQNDTFSHTHYVKYEKYMRILPLSLARKQRANWLLSRILIRTVSSHIFRMCFIPILPLPFLALETSLQLRDS